MNLSKKQVFMFLLVVIAVAAVYWPDIKSSVAKLMEKGAAKAASNLNVSHETLSLKLEKSKYAPGEEIRVYFSAPAGYPNDAWIGIIPSNVPHGSEVTNDQHDITYQYLGGKTSGTLTFQAPARRGLYDFRMHDTDANGREVASVSFAVARGGEVESPEATLNLEKTKFSPGEQITVHFKAPSGFADNAWVGIIPSNVPHGSEATNDQNDIAYQYLSRRTSGSLKFHAPAQPGDYDFRMNDSDSDGKEVASVSFVVQ